jgi:hypothetical protein
MGWIRTYLWPRVHGALFWSNMADSVHFPSYFLMTDTVSQVDKRQTVERDLHIRRICYTQRTHKLFRQRIGGSQTRPVTSSASVQEYRILGLRGESWTLESTVTSQCLRTWFVLFNNLWHFKSHNILNTSSRKKLPIKDTGKEHLRNKITPVHVHGVNAD